MTSLQQEIKEAAAGGRGRALRASEVEALFKKWLPEGLKNCRVPEHCPAGTCIGRCSAEYWSNHDRVVASLMRRFAIELGEDPWLYYVTGAVHDLDYVRFPHDKPGSDPAYSHPIPITRELLRIGAPPLMSLAVLEHAPHLNLPPSSPLTHALIACGDSTTFAAAGAEIAWPHDLSSTFVEILNTAPHGTLVDPSINPKRIDRIFNSLRALTWHAS